MSLSSAEVVVVDLQEVARGYRISRILGTDVLNDRNEVVGTVDDLILGRDQDRVQFAILQVGGFLGLGGYLVAVEFNSLKLDQDADGNLVIRLPGATQDSIRNLPEFQYGNQVPKGS